MAESIRLRVLKMLRDRLHGLFDGGAHLSKRATANVFETLPAAVLLMRSDRYTGNSELGGYDNSTQGRVQRECSIVVAVKLKHDEKAHQSDPNEVEWTDEAIDPHLQTVEKAAIAMNTDPEFISLFGSEPVRDDQDRYCFFEVVESVPDARGDTPGAAFAGCAVSLRLTYWHSAHDPAVP